MSRSPALSASRPTSTRPTAQYTVTITVTDTFPSSTLSPAKEMFQVTVGGPQTLAGIPASAPNDTPDLTEAEPQPAVGEAFSLPAAVGFNASGLSLLDFYVAPAGDSMLGVTPQKNNWIDVNAEGYSWYAGVLVASGAAFAQPDAAGEFATLPGSLAFDNVDQLTVVTHDWMTATLETGVRCYPDQQRPTGTAASAADQVNAALDTVFSTAAPVLEDDRLRPLTQAACGPVPGGMAVGPLAPAAGLLADSIYEWYPPNTSLTSDVIPQYEDNQAAVEMVFATWDKWTSIDWDNADD